MGRLIMMECCLRFLHARFKEFDVGQHGQSFWQVTYMCQVLAAILSLNWNLWYIKIMIIWEVHAMDLSFFLRQEGMSLACIKEESLKYKVFLWA